MIARIERAYRQPPGWWASLTAEQRATLIALHRIDSESG
jgi:hypothetical protein